MADDHAYDHAASSSLDVAEVVVDTYTDIEGSESVNSSDDNVERDGIVTSDNSEGSDSANSSDDNVERNGIVTSDDSDSINDDEQDENRDNDQAANAGIRRKSYTLNLKLKALDTLRENEGNVSKTARDTGVARKNIQRWKKEERVLTEMKSKRRVNIRKNRRKLYRSSGKYPAVEVRLLQWVKDQRALEHAVNQCRLRDKAREIVHTMIRNGELDGGENFKISKGWCVRFLRRNNLVKRRFTSVGQKVPPNAADLIKVFHASIVRVINQHHITMPNICNMDEVPMYFDMPRSNTIDFKGVRTVKGKTTGHEHLRLTAVFAAMSNGTKLPPMIIFKGLKRVPNERFPAGIHVCVSMGGSMTTELIKQHWIPNVWYHRPGRLFNAQSLLVWDKHRSHTEPSVSATLQRHHATTTAVVPAGCTPLVQPLDVVLNKPIKDTVRDKWERWIADGEVELTRGGRRKRVSYGLMARWILEAWQELPRETVCNSFVKCGVNRDGGNNEDLLTQRLRDLLQNGVIPEDEEILISSDSDSESSDMDDEENN